MFFPSSTPPRERPTPKSANAAASIATRIIAHILESFAIAGCALYPTAVGVQLVTAIQAKNDARRSATPGRPVRVDGEIGGRRSAVVTRRHAGDGEVNIVARPRMPAGQTAAARAPERTLRR